MEYMEAQAALIKLSMNLFFLSTDETIFILVLLYFRYASFDFYAIDLTISSLSLLINLYDLEKLSTSLRLII